MTYRLEVTYKITDARAIILKNTLNKSVADGITYLEIRDIFTVDKSLTKNQLGQILEMLVNPITHEGKFSKNIDLPKKADWLIEIGFLPGVTDNIAATTKELIESHLKIKFADKEGVYTSRAIIFSGKLNKSDITAIAESLCNPLIQRINIYDLKTAKRAQPIQVPRVHLNHKPSVSKVSLNTDDKKLEIMGQKGIVNQDGSRRGPLALSLPYMQAIQKNFRRKKRPPTDVELESIAQTWSEHCKHTIFASPLDEIKEGLFKHYIKAATEKIRETNDFCASVFTDNAGAIIFDDNYLITHKVETHNSPSALDPYGGALTGIVGVNRDALGFGLGAKPIVNTYGFCFGLPDDTTPLYRDSGRKQKLMSPKRILEGVVSGVNTGGNCSGIPTPQGFVYFDKSYKGKPLVFVGTVGLIPKKIGKQKSYEKKAQPGDYIVMIGGRVGKDGIHGATFSSVALDEGSPVSAVQIGDPITQKKFSDAIIREARDKGLYHSITDNGAGGLSCSVSEMARESGGCQVQLDKVPLKYAGLDPWEVWTSESQERMTVAVPPGKWRQFAKLMNSRGVETTIIGTFTKSGKCVVKTNGKTVMEVPLDFIHNGLPKIPLRSSPTFTVTQEPNIPLKNDLTDTFLTILSRPNCASYEFISMQYDHEVQGSSVLKPLQGKGRINGETSVVRPLLNSSQGLVLSQGLYPRYSLIDTYHMAAAAIDTAVRNVISTGADPKKIALLDNFCWCSSDDPKRLYELKRAAAACYDFAVAYGTPFISGKDSMFNDFKGYDSSGNQIKISVLPTLLISSIGIISDISKVVSLDLKMPGDLIYILGATHEELGGSEYYSMHDAVGVNVPRVNAENNKAIYSRLHQSINKGFVASSISVTLGGLGVALAKTALGGMLGVDINLKNVANKTSRDDFALFSESQGRILVSVNPKNKNGFEKLVQGINFAQIGKVRSDDRMIIRGRDGKNIVQTTLDTAMKQYKKLFEQY